MEVSLPCVYAKTVVPKRRKQSVRETHVCRVAAEIPEVAAVDTVEVAKWNWTRASVDMLCSPVETVVRRWSGRHYLPCARYGRPGFMSADLPSAARPWSPRAAEMLEVYGFDPTDHFPATIYEDYVQAFRDPDYRRGSWPSGSPYARDPVAVSDTREENEAIVRGIAKSLLVIDGRVWQATERPVFQVYFGDPESAYGGILSASGGYGMRALNPDWAYRQFPMGILRFSPGDMRAVAAATEGMHLKTECSDIAVLDPEGLPLDTVEDLLARTMDFAVYRTRGDVGGMPRAKAGRWLEISAFVDRWRADAVACAPEGALDALRAFSEELEDEPLRNAIRSCLAAYEEARVDGGRHLGERARNWKRQAT